MPKPFMFFSFLIKIMWEAHRGRILFDFFRKLSLFVALLQSVNAITLFLP